MPTTCLPNLTASKLRRVCGDCCLRRYRVDPLWGIPEGVPPLFLEVATGLIRPYSSFTSFTNVLIALAAGNIEFVGFSSEWFPPGEDHLVWVYTCGWVEMRIVDYTTAILTPTAVETGDAFYFGVADAQGTPDNDSVVSGPSPYFKAVESCWCQNDWVKRANCLVDPPAANNTSPMVALEAAQITPDRILQSTVILQFGNCCQAQPEFAPT